MKKILFPTEFSSHAPEVFRFAVELAYFFDARLIMMYAYSISDYGLASNQKNEEQANKATERMIDFVTSNIPETYRKEIKVDYVAKKGLSSKAILEVAVREDVDLIVMGMTGMTNAADILVGSTTMSVLAKADCPVLMIPADAKFEGIDNMVYTTNFEFRDLAVINYLKKWSKKFKAPLHCFHVIEEGDDRMSAIKNMDILRTIFKRQKRMSFDFESGKIDEEIEKFIKKKRADVLIMIEHKKNFLTRILDRSRVNEIAHDVSIPLLVMKDNGYELNVVTGEWLKVVHSIA
ncbi:MAG: nucleotide-binding universal stress UspA family protein [Polaribacter sp.]|jgi:nucleotide-binding universal stress UspA family protein